MRRLYYMADHVDDAQAVMLALQRLGISQWHLHVLAKDEAGLYTHKIHSANPIHQLDIVHTAARFALTGMVCGAILAGTLYLLAQLGLVNFSPSPLVLGSLVLLGLCFGAWEGGMVGLTRENYKIERFHDDIDAGKYLIMVDVKRHERPMVRELMNFEFSHIPYRGGGDTRIEVFAKPKVTHHQTTH